LYRVGLAEDEPRALYPGPWGADQATYRAAFWYPLEPADRAPARICAGHAACLAMLANRWEVKFSWGALQADADGPIFQPGAHRPPAHPDLYCGRQRASMPPGRRTVRGFS